MDRSTILRGGIRLLAGLLILPTTLAAQGIGLRIPPSQVHMVALGMGGAAAADGTFFNATAFNPALLARAPKGVEAFNLGVNVSNDLFGVIDYVQDLNFQADRAFQDMADGLFGPDAGTPTGDQLVTDGLSEVQDLANNLTHKAAQAGAGLQVAVRVNEHFGVQVYNQTRAYAELFQGKLTESIAGIPLPYDSGSSGAAVSQLVTALQDDLEDGINDTLSPGEVAAIQSDIDDLKDGTIDLDTFLYNVGSTLGSVDLDLLERNILNSLVEDLAVLSALALSDTVVMGTFNFDPSPDIPLTVGANLKLVNRRIAFANIASAENSGILDNLGSDFSQSTTRFGLDLGFLYKVKPANLDLGLSVQDLIHQGASIETGTGSSLHGVVTDPAPVVVRFGASWSPAPGLRIDADVDDLLSETTLYEGDRSGGRFKFGAGYSALGFRQLRAGFGNGGVAAGIGALAGFVGLDYTFAADDLSQSHNHYGRFQVVF